MKKIKIVLLTTKTVHHYYFINQIINLCELTVIEETKFLKPKFKTFHEYEKKQNQYELKRWFNNKKLKIIENIKIFRVRNINEIKTVKIIEKFEPNLIFSYGVSKISKEVITKIKKKIFNFHGGDINYYRGLDSHLWSLYHKDYNGMKVTLHQVDAKLDTGKILMIKKLNLNKIKELYQLRSITTELCVLIAKNIIKKIKIYSKKPNKIGRYYSFMPKDLKTIVNKNFKKLIYGH
jgi:methionyl-tRNA formyltransferase